jgi:N-acetylglucosaminyl-diphospho-decaprenol L-rhamnosyltransferase
MPSDGDVSVVILSHNSWSHLERALSAVTPLGHEVIVVDNDSTDSTADWVRRSFPGVRVIALRENVGFARGNNIGIDAASGGYLLLMNADAWPAEGAVDALVACAERSPRAGVVAPRLLNHDGSLQRSVRAFPTLWRLATEYFFLRKLAPRSRVLNAFYAGGFDHDLERDVDWVKGAVLLLRREAVEAVGAFDSAFFIFSDEVDLCYRLRLAGWCTRFYPGAVFWHIGGASTGSEWSRFQRELLRGHLRFFAKHYGLRHAERARLLLLIALSLRGVMFRGERGRLYRDAARWLRQGAVERLLDVSPSIPRAETTDELEVARGSSAGAMHGTRS